MERPWHKHWPPGVPRKMEYPRSTLTEYIQEHATHEPERPAVNFYGKRISYGELNRMIDSFAAFLVSSGLQKGDRVCVFMENCPQFIISICGSWKAGAVVVPVNPLYNEEELAFLLRDSGAETIVLLDNMYPVLHSASQKAHIRNVIVTGYSDFLPVDPELPLPASMEVPRQFFPGTVEMSYILNRGGAPPALNINSEDDLALLYYTSRISSPPLGAMISHRSMMANIICASLWTDVPGGVHLAVMPLYNVSGLVHCLCTPLYAGSGMVLLAKFDTGTVMKAVEQYRCTHWVSVATMKVAVVNHPEVSEYDLTSLRYCGTGGFPVPGDVRRRFKEITGVDINAGYGMCETISQVAINPRGLVKEGSVGIPVINTQIKIEDLYVEGRDALPGEPGELVVSGPQVMNGYWGQPASTAMVLKDGWFYTGDVACMDDDGFIYILGKKKEMIMVSGYGVFPAEVEEVLLQHPAVAEVAVVGRPDAMLGESVKAYIVLKREFENRVSERDIIAWASERTPTLKYPREVEFKPDLPRSGSGKVLRRVVAELP